MQIFFDEYIKPGIQHNKILFLAGGDFTYENASSTFDFLDTVLKEATYHSKSIIGK